MTMLVKGTFYNKEIKEAYLTSISGDSDKETIAYLLGKASPIEELLERDVYTFSLKELGTVIKIANPIYNKVAENMTEHFTNYIHWAINNGLRDSSIHPLFETHESWSHQFVDEKTLYISEETLLEIEEGLANFQDKVVIRLPFEGVLGTECSEICQLKEEDINFQTGIATVYDKKSGKRETKLSNRALELIKGALHEKQYNKWGDEGETENTTDIIDNQFVIRGLVKKGVPAEAKPESNITVYRRINRIMEKSNLPYITAKQLLRSGEKEKQNKG